MWNEAEHVGSPLINTGLSDCTKRHVGEFMKLSMSEYSDILSFSHPTNMPSDALDGVRVHQRVTDMLSLIQQA